METEVLTVTVSQLNNYIKRVMENNSYLKDIWVKGEISNFKLHYSGHIYMTLKDDHAAVRAVMFRGAAARLRFQPENGMKAICRGRVSVYERDGQYQLYVEEIQPDGLGALHMAFEQLKQKLGEEGLFDDSYKKPLPPTHLSLESLPPRQVRRCVISFTCSAGVFRLPVCVFVRFWYKGNRPRVKLPLQSIF